MKFLSQREEPEKEKKNREYRDLEKYTRNLSH